MIENLMTEGGRLVLGFGVLGVYAIIVTWALWWAVKELRSESGVGARTAQKIIEVIGKSNDVSDRVADALSEATRATEGVSSNVIQLAGAFKAMGEMQQVQRERLMDMLKDVKSDIGTVARRMKLGGNGGGE